MQNNVQGTALRRSGDRIIRIGDRSSLRLNSIVHKRTQQTLSAIPKLWNEYFAQYFSLYLKQRCSMDFLSLNSTVASYVDHTYTLMKVYYLLKILLSSIKWCITEKVISILFLNTYALTSLSDCIEVLQTSTCFNTQRRD